MDYIPCESGTKPFREFGAKMDEKQNDGNVQHNHPHVAYENPALLLGYTTGGDTLSTGTAPQAGSSTNALVHKQGRYCSQLHAGVRPRFSVFWPPYSRFPKGFMQPFLGLD